MRFISSISGKTKFLIAVIFILLAILCIAVWFMSSWFFQTHQPGSAEAQILQYARENGIPPWEYPEELIDLLRRNPETEQFVLEYPRVKNDSPVIDMTEYLDSGTVPLFLQWDSRWGYIPYGSSVAGLTGCGPMCLSMAAIYVTGDASFSPDHILAFAAENNYYVSGIGSSWTLISEGGPKLGLSVTELPLDKGRIQRALEAGAPVICAMGSGDFTTSGHFIVITGMQDDMFTVNDPNSRINSEKLWSYDRIQGQIRNLWSVSANPTT